MDMVAIAAGGGGVVVGFVAGFLAGRRGPVGETASGNEATGEGIELYVGNLSYDMTDPELKKVFAVYGNVLSARVIKNKFNDRSKGYGFVEMDGQAASDKAVKALNGKDVMGRKLVVNEARSKSRD